jgi:gliding motility-associatede transport system auxiliary component
VVSLVTTAPQSWAETDLKNLQDPNSQITFDPQTDQQGPISLAATAENTQQKSRVVIFGDADFASDSYFTAYANSDLFMNSVDWAARKENLINLTPKQSTQRLMVPPQRVTLNLIFLGTVFVLPGLALLSGITVWIQRRRRG